MKKCPRKAATIILFIIIVYYLLICFFFINFRNVFLFFYRFILTFIWKIFSTTSQTKLSALWARWKLLQQNPLRLKLLVMSVIICVFYLFFIFIFYCFILFFFFVLLLFYKNFNVERVRKNFFMFFVDYDYSDKKFSTWTESIWNTPRLRMFMKPSPAWEGGVFGVGLAVFLISMVSVYVLNKGSETLFASNVVAL